MKNFSVKQLVYCAMLAALAIILVWLVRLPIFPAAPFLEYEMADVPILIGTFMFGSLPGLMLTAVVSVLQGLLVSQASGWVGVVMHFLATGAFVLVVGGIYQRKRNVKNMIVAAVCGTITMILVMLPLNLVFSSFFYMKVPLSQAFINTLQAFIATTANTTSALIIGVVGAFGGGCAFYFAAIYGHAKHNCRQRIFVRISAGAICAIIFAFLVVLPLNLLFGDVQLPDAMNSVVTLLWTAILPFNAIKAGANAILACGIFPIIKKAVSHC